ncbi:uncharacterized protein JCM15063_004791 [Sporobolomyces koalae]|uniref:uncharacterized protein n=1 Tax=Sporobolomyces koalae TaxID=500713 RepID=UPI003180D79B
MTDYTPLTFDPSAWSALPSDQRSMYAGDSIGLLSQPPHQHGASAGPSWTTWFPPTHPSLALPSSLASGPANLPSPGTTSPKRTQADARSDPVAATLLALSPLDSPTATAATSPAPRQSPFKPQAPNVHNLITPASVVPSPSPVPAAASPASVQAPSPLSASAPASTSAAVPTSSQAQAQALQGLSFDLHASAPLSAPTRPESVAMQQFLNGYNALQNPGLYPAAISSEEYIRLLKQATSEHQHLFGSASSPTSLSLSAGARPSSSSAGSNHSSMQVVNPPSGSSASSSSAATASSTFSLPPPAAYNLQQQHPHSAHHSRPHERTPSTSSSIRTSSNDRASVIDSPRGSYPTYPSPQPTNPIHAHYPSLAGSTPSGLQPQSPLNPYLAQFGLHHQQQAVAAAAADGGYDPSEPYIPLHQQHQHHQQQLASAYALQHQLQQQHQQQQQALQQQQQQQPTSFAPVAAIIPPSLGFCPPAPAPIRPSQLTSTSTASSPAGTTTSSSAKGKGKLVSLDSDLAVDPILQRSGSTGSLRGRSRTRRNDLKRKCLSEFGTEEDRDENEIRPPLEPDDDEVDDDHDEQGRDEQDSREEVNTSEDDDDVEEGEEEGEDPIPTAFTTEPVASSSNASASMPLSLSNSQMKSLRGTIVPNMICPRTGQLRRQTEVPAVEDDPSVRPYGCNYCYLDRTVDDDTWAYWKEQEAVHDDMKIGWRTVKELREHNNAFHKERTDLMKELEQHVRETAAGKGPDLPFRCALEPCGKTFKSLAGLRFHFQNASANGHFFLTIEKDQHTGLERPTKKFKQDIQPNGRELTCPVERCPKRFKQSAGLAYHLSHTPNHEITEALVSSFENTLQSKTRWWFKKLGLAFAPP